MITSREFLQCEKVGELMGMYIRADKYGEKFIFISNENWNYMSEEDRESIESITEYKRNYHSIGALKHGTLHCLGYNL